MRLLQATVSNHCLQCQTRALRNEWSAYRNCMCGKNKVWIVWETWQYMRLLQATVTNPCLQCLTRALRDEWSAHRNCMCGKNKVWIVWETRQYMRFLQAPVSNLCRRCLTRPLRNVWSAHSKKHGRKEHSTDKHGNTGAPVPTNYLDQKNSSHRSNSYDKDSGVFA